MDKHTKAQVSNLDKLNREVQVLEVKQGMLELYLAQMMKNDPIKNGAKKLADELTGDGMG